MARLVFRSAHREVLWRLTGAGWRTRTLPADDLYVLCWPGALAVQHRRAEIRMHLAEASENDA
jgi:hypothetical protein